MTLTSGRTIAKISHKSVSLKQRGFTLIEVLVAIAVVGFAVPPLMFLMSKQADNTVHLQHKAIAISLADSALNRLRLDRQLSGTSLRSVTEETIEQAGLEWTVSTEPTETEFGSLLRYRTTVSLTPDNPVVVLDTFVH